MPVEEGKFRAWLLSQRGWGDSTNWQAANSRQLEQWNWKNGRQQIWDYVLGFSKFFCSRNTDTNGTKTWTKWNSCIAMAGHLHETFNTCTGKTKYKTEQSENHKKKTSVIQNFSITVTNFSNNNIHNIKKKCNSKYPHTWCTYLYVSACGWWVSWTV